jgi:Arc/MetJ family transcription regulator
MRILMRTTIELSDRTYALLRSAAAERGLRGFSAIVEEALVRALEAGGEDELRRAAQSAEGAWSAEAVREWEAERQAAWAGWTSERSSTPTS